MLNCKFLSTGVWGFVRRTAPHTRESGGLREEHSLTRGSFSRQPSLRWNRKIFYQNTGFCPRKPWDSREGQPPIHGSLNKGPSSRWNFRNLFRRMILHTRKSRFCPRESRGRTDPLVFCSRRAELVMKSQKFLPKTQFAIHGSLKNIKQSSGMSQFFYITYYQCFFLLKIFINHFGKAKQRH